MTKTASIYTRVDPEVKVQVEQVLSKLGIPMANAINLFLHQIILHEGIPFDVKLPAKRPLNCATLSQAQFDAEMEKGFEDLETGQIISAKQVRENMGRRYTT